VSFVKDVQQAGLQIEAIGYYYAGLDSYGHRVYRHKSGAEVKLSSTPRSPYSPNNAVDEAYRKLGLAPPSAQAKRKPADVRRRERMEREALNKRRAEASSETANRQMAAHRSRWESWARAREAGLVGGATWGYFQRCPDVPIPEPDGFTPYLKELDRLMREVPGVR